jgi:hypothetical protein
VFDHVARNCSKQANDVAAEIGADEKLLYRLMRALASLTCLFEDESRGFATSEAGELLRSDHPQSLRYWVLNAEGPEHYAIWKHLPDIIRDGKQDGFIREFGARAFDYARANSRYRRTFDQGMTGHSTTQTNLVLEALIGGTRQNLSGLDSAGSTDVRSHFASSIEPKLLAAREAFTRP